MKIINKSNLSYLLFSVVFGTAFALFYQEFSFSIFFLIAFLALTQYTREYLKVFKNKPKHVWRLYILLTLFISLLIYFALVYSWYLLIALALASLLLQFEFLFNHFELKREYAILSFLIYIGLMNSLAFYIHTRFISSTLVYLLLSIIALTFLVKIVIQKRSIKI